MRSDALFHMHLKIGKCNSLCRIHVPSLLVWPPVLLCWHLQGATDAHEFFVLESGSCDVYVTRPGDITAKKVKSYGPGSAFGELALLYAAPRAATVRECRRGLGPGLQLKGISRGDMCAAHALCLAHCRGSQMQQVVQTPATVLTCRGPALSQLLASQLTLLGSHCLVQTDSEPSSEQPTAANARIGCAQPRLQECCWTTDL